MEIQGENLEVPQYIYPLGNVPVRIHNTEGHALSPGTIYAIDFLCPPDTPTPVFAARSGKVITAKGDSKRTLDPTKWKELICEYLGKTEQQLIDEGVDEAQATEIFAEIANKYTNMVVVEHSDGTRAEYLHVGELKVKKGDSVIVGETELGKVDRSGLSTKLHLHFNVVHQVGEGVWESIQVNFTSEEVRQKIKKVLRGG